MFGPNPLTTRQWPASIAPLWATLWLLVCLGLAYLPDIGRGFISDDFGWIARSRVQSTDDLIAPVLGAPTGFYRPLVSWTFAANYALFGLRPMGYALTNLALALGICAVIARLVRRLGFSAHAALLAAGLWAFNLHGVGMALTWISGRTSLLTTLFAVLAALAATRQRAWLAGAWTLAALLSKEEPILLPVILLAWASLDARPRPWATALAQGWRTSWASVAALGLYLLLRQRTPAFTARTAPDVYALTLSPRVLGSNALEYLDRSLTVTAAVLLLAVILFARRAPMVERSEHVAVVKGLIWFVLASAVTMLVPVRSDLYACLPSVGASVAGAALGTAIWRSIPWARRRLAATSLLLLPLALVPVFRARNRPARNEATLSARLLATTTSALASRPHVTNVEIVQLSRNRPSVVSALGSHLPNAVLLTTGRSIEARITIAPDGAPAQATDDETLRLTVSGGEIRQQ